MSSTTTLERLGYVLCFREDGWAECLVSRGEERWLGRGPDRDAALEDALRQMLPSYAARDLWALRVAEAETTASPLPPVEQEPPVSEEEETPAPGTPLALMSEPRVEAPLAASPPSFVASGPPDDPTGRDAPQAPPSAAVDSPPSAITEAPPVAVLLAELTRLFDGVVESRGEVAVMAPRWQQLSFVAWLSRGRAVVEARPYNSSVRTTMTRLASTVAQMSKLFWPGYVPALRMDAVPADVMAALNTRGQTVTSWAEAADAAEAQFAVETGVDGVDEYGWRDASRLLPPPLSPDEILEEVRGIVEETVGDPSLPPEGDLDATIQGLTHEALQRLVGVARQLRWIRAATSTPERWGEIMGRLRCTAHKLGTRGQALGTALDPAFVPATSWATQVQGDSEKPQRALRRRELVEARPRRDGAPSSAALAPWLLETLEVFSNPEIAALFPEIATPVATIDLDAPQLSRGLRRRLKALKNAFDTQAPRAGAPGETDVVIELDDAGGPDVADAADALVSLVRARIDGWTGLFVSNREDRELERQIEERLGLQIEWCDATPRRIEAQVARVSEGSYQIVIGATGFFDHATDAALSRAARRAGVPYVRAYRGRTLACARAIARQLGITPEETAA